MWWCREKYSDNIHILYMSFSICIITFVMWLVDFSSNCVCTWIYPEFVFFRSGPFNRSLCLYAFGLR